MRVFLAALALCALSFAAGVVGDLSVASTSRPSAVVRLPPLPANVVRAHPLPPLRHVQAAPARAHVQAIHRLRRARPLLIAAREKPLTIQIVTAAKVDPDRAPKDDGPGSAAI